LQPRAHTVATSSTYGCSLQHRVRSLEHIGLQPWLNRVEARRLAPRMGEGLETHVRVGTDHPCLEGAPGLRQEWECTLLPVVSNGQPWHGSHTLGPSPWGVHETPRVRLYGALTEAAARTKLRPRLGIRLRLGLGWGLGFGLRLWL